MHILSLVLGILGVVVIFVPLVNLIFAPMLSCAAIITGALARTLMRYKEKEDDRRIAAAGLLLGSLGMLMSLMLYGACAWLIDRWYEPEPEVLTSEGEEEIEERIGRVESELEEELERLGDLIEDRIEDMEERLSQGPGVEVEDSDELKEKAAEGQSKKPALKKPGKAGGKGVAKKTRPKPAKGAATTKGMKMPKVFKDVPDAKEYELLTPYDYF